MKMQSSSEFIINNIKEMFRNSKDLFVVPDIPEKKLKGASKAFKIDEKNILALYDNTMLGGADEGIVFTSEKLILKMDSNVIDIFYRDIKSFKYISNVMSKGKAEKVIESVMPLTNPMVEFGTKLLKDKIMPTRDSKIIIQTHDDNEFIIEKIIEDEYLKPFADFVKKLLEECDIQSFVSESINELFKPLEDMSKELRVAFVKIVINMAFENEEQIDDKERSEIILLINRIKLDREERFGLLSYMAEIQNTLTPVKDLVEIIKNSCEKSIHYKAVMISLVQNLFNLYANTQFKNQGDSFKLPDSFDFLEKYKDIFGLSSKEIDVAKTAVENDLKILNEDIDSDKIKEITKDLAAKAASVGLPIGAVYVSGSVVGLSAAGMTSGLASLGFGGILVLSSMATGIGVAVLLGVGVYQGIKYLTDDNKQLEALKTREMMIQEVLKQTQKSISLMIGDINVIVQKLNNVILNDNEKSQTIEKLKKMIVAYTGAMSKTNEKYEQCENLKSRIECPKILEVSRISSLKDKHKEAYDFILSCYERSKKNNQMELKEHIETEKLENLAEILKGLDYFSTMNILKDKATSKVKNLF